MKKTIMYAIAILLLTITVMSGTYAFFSATATSGNTVKADASTFEVIYNGGTSIDKPISVVSSKEEGLNTTVNIRMATNSTLGKATLYINIEEITDNIAIKAFKWEVYGYKNGEEVYKNNGDFDGAKNNDIINIVTDYPLTEENTAFTIYFWLDGELSDNNVLNSRFSGYIGAQTENFTANLQ